MLEVFGSSCSIWAMSTPNKCGAYLWPLVSLSFASRKVSGPFLTSGATPCATVCASVVLHCSDANERWEYGQEQNGLPLLTRASIQRDADRKRANARTLQSVRQEDGGLPLRLTGSERPYGRDESCLRRCICGSHLRDFAAQTLVRLEA